MNNLLLIAIALMAFWLLPSRLLAADITVVSSVSADKVGLEDSFTFTISVETTSNEKLLVDVKLVDFPAKYARPNISNMSSTSFVNGKMSSSRTQSHNYAVYPEKEGILNIPKFTVLVNNETYSTQEHKVEVVAGSIRSQNPPKRRSFSPFSSFFDDDRDVFSTPRRRESSAFLQLEVSRDSIYIGQNISAKYTYYTLNNTNNISSDMQTYDGYGIENSQPGDKTWKIAKYNGKQYYKLEIVTLDISAQQAGLLTLPSITINESNFYNNNTYKSPIKQLLVKDLPKKGKSIDFSNAVGKFTLKSELAQGLMYENQQNQLVVTIEGRGNFAKILYPQAPQVDGLEVLKPKAVLNLGKGDQGTLVLNYDIIPYESGKFRIPAIGFTYFDDVQRKYQTLYTESDLLTVKSLGSGAGDSDIKDFNVFFSRHKPYLGNIVREHLLTNKISYWLFLGLLILIIIAYTIFYKFNQKRMNDIGFMRKREALSILKKGITDAEIFVRNKNLKFYTHTQNVLLKFIAKITRASLQLSQQELIQELEKSSINKVTVGKINSFLTYSEQIKYRPNYKSNENILDDFQKFQDIYNEIKNSQG